MGAFERLKRTFSFKNSKSFDASTMKYKKSLDLPNSKNSQLELRDISNNYTLNETNGESKAAVTNNTNSKSESNGCDITFTRRSSIRRAATFISRALSFKKESESYNKDIEKIKFSNIQFLVKYLGKCEVSSPRGTQICSQAVHDIKSNKSYSATKVVMIISSDYCRLLSVSEKELILDQVMEKISFCTPDPFDPYLFSFICRDGVSRKWICHCFTCIDDTGKRLSNAFGCAFSICLEKKQAQKTFNDNKLLTSTPSKNGCHVGKLTNHSLNEVKLNQLTYSCATNAEVLKTVSGSKSVLSPVNSSNKMLLYEEKYDNIKTSSNNTDDDWIKRAFEKLNIKSEKQQKEIENTRASTNLLMTSELANNNPFKADACDPCLINPPPFSSRRRSVMN